MIKKEQLRNFFWKRKVTKILSKNKRFRQSTNLKNANQVGIYSIYENAEQFDSIIKFSEKLRQQGKVVKTLIYLPKPQTVSKIPPSMSVLHPTQISFAKFPLKTAVKVWHFIYEDFDILFDTSLNFHHMDISVLSASNAKFKTGKAGEWNSRVNDFSISFKDNVFQEEMLQIMQEYLKIF
jgi:hypothetical protein